MKEFAFPISITCSSEDDRKDCLRLLHSIGYSERTIIGYNRIITNYLGYSSVLTDVPNSAHIDQSRYHIHHFDRSLIRDIASVCVGAYWIKGEPYVRIYKSSRHYHEGGQWGIFDSTGLEVANTNKRRPRLDEICDYHGYYISGKNIIKKGRISNNHYSYNECNFNDYANSSTEKAAIAMLRYVETKTGCKYSLTKTESVETKLL